MLRIRAPDESQDLGEYGKTQLDLEMLAEK